MSGEYVPAVAEICASWVSENRESFPTPRWENATKAAEKALAAHDARVASEAAEKALRDAADKWTQGAWANDLPPRGADRPALIIGTSQRAGDFMRARADRIAAERKGGT